MSDTPFMSLLPAMRPDGDRFAVDLPADWLQGRTAYGGLSAALCYESARCGIPGLPPLRSAQFAFVGPASGTLRLSPSVLRQGKSSCFVAVDLDGEAGLAVRGLLCFGASRGSVFNQSGFPAPPVAAPDACPPYFLSAERPAFARHFDGRLAGGARPRTPSEVPEMVVWMKHVDPASGSGLTGLIALADALPPAAMVLFTEPHPISTMTWSIDLMTDEPASESGWWLIRSSAQTVAAGYSAQDMAIWDDRARPVAAMRQTVAIFG